MGCISVLVFDADLKLREPKEGEANVPEYILQRLPTLKAMKAAMGRRK
jgi:hypothetical protein